MIEACAIWLRLYTIVFGNLFYTTWNLDLVTHQLDYVQVGYNVQICIHLKSWILMPTPQPLVML
jgi:hypothetical protein